MTRQSERRLGWIPSKVFSEHLALFPIITADIVVTDASDRFLLLKRSAKNYAWRGEWATPGGRIFRDEKTVSAAKRILKRETGLTVPTRDLNLKGVVDIITEREHAVTVVYGTRATRLNVVIDETSSEANWFARADLPRRLRREYRTILSF